MHIIIGYMLFISTTTAQAAVYKWTDKDGQMHFSDRPALGAEYLRVEKSISIADTKDANNDDGKLLSPYTDFAITAPQDGQAIVSADSGVTVELSLQPPLQGEDAIQLTVDGGVLPKRFKGTRVKLKPLTVGTHKIYATVVDGAGKPQVTSATVTFHLHNEATEVTTKAPDE